MTTDVEESEQDVHAGFFQELESASAALHAFNPDLVVVFGPDHFNGFFYELMPAFCIGTSAEAEPAPESGRSCGCRASWRCPGRSAGARLTRRSPTDEGRSRHHHSALQAHGSAGAL
jgi:hypothetical protein